MSKVKGEITKKTEGLSMVQRAQTGDSEAAQAYFAEARTSGRYEAICQALYEIYFSEEAARAGKNRLLETAMQETFAKKRKELGYETASPLERLLIERIVLCWHDLQSVEGRYHKGLASPDGLTIEVSTFYQKAMDRAQRRYLAAIQSLALVRRLQIPAVQVNIGEKQVNLVQSAPIHFTSLDIDKP